MLQRAHVAHVKSTVFDSGSLCGHMEDHHCSYTRHAGCVTAEELDEKAPLVDELGSTGYRRMPDSGMLADAGRVWREVVAGRQVGKRMDNQTVGDDPLSSSAFSLFAFRFPERRIGQVGWLTVADRNAMETQAGRTRRVWALGRPSMAKPRSGCPRSAEVSVQGWMNGVMVDIVVTG